LQCKGYPTTGECNIGLSAFGPGSVNFTKTYQNDILKSIEIVLSKALAQKAMNLDEKWAHLSDDLSDPLHRVVTFCVPSSSDGFGFKVYQNQSASPVMVQFNGTINNGKICKAIFDFSVSGFRARTVFRFGVQN
jgi:hypothetical protein